MYLSYRTLTLTVFLFLLRGAGFAQRSDPFFGELPFTQWAMAAVQPSEIPWKVRVVSGGLTTHQRISAFIHIDIDGRFLAQRSGQGNLFVLVQITDGEGRAYQDHSELPILDDAKEKEALRKIDAFFDWRMFVLPGRYSVEVAVFDKSTGKHGFTRQPLRIEALSKDPLPGAWRDEPTVEFLKLGEPPDTFFHPESETRLCLPLQSRRKVRIELLANLTGSERAMVSHTAYNFNLTSLLPILKTFSQIEVSKGSLNVTVLDLIRRRIAFAQADVHTLDWPALKTAVAAGDPTKVDVKALADVRHTAAFLRNEVAQRLQPGNEDSSTLPVLILISSSDFFDSLADLSDIPLPAECDCMVYYVRYSPFALRYRFAPAEFDNVRRVLKPLRVRTHMAETPADLRRIIAEIVDEISKM